MKTDKEILDEIEAALDKFLDTFYANQSSEIQMSVAAYALGLITGIIMKRGKQ